MAGEGVVAGGREPAVAVPWTGVWSTPVALDAAGGGAGATPLLVLAGSVGKGEAMGTPISARPGVLSVEPFAAGTSATICSPSHHAAPSNKDCASPPIGD